MGKDMIIKLLESQLKERDKSLDKANNQLHGMSRLLEKKGKILGRYIGHCIR